MKTDRFDLVEALSNKEDKSIIIWLFNIGVEKFWNGDNYTVKDKNEDIIVNHMEEMNFLITRKQDILILRRYPSNIFIKQMEFLGYEVPEILCPQEENEDKSISELVLEDEILIKRLSEIEKREAVVRFVPYGISNMEEQIAEKCGLILAGAPAEMNKKINDKIYSRQIALNLGMPVTEGMVCSNIIEVEEACKQLLGSFEKVIIKMPYGASGKGLYVIDSEKKMKSVLMILNRFSKRNSESEWLVEGWYEKKTDINIQVYINAQGEVTTFSIKEQLLTQTVYIGTVLPPRLTEDKYEAFMEYGNRIGAYFSEQHFEGILGIDAMVTSEGTLIPIIEINARFTLSTYLSFLYMRYPGRKILASYLKLSLQQGVSYEEFLKAFIEAKISWELGKQEGVIIYASETVNSALTGKNGRLFTIAIANSYEEVVQLKKRIDEIAESINKEHTEGEKVYG